MRRIEKSRPDLFYQRPLPGGFKKLVLLAALLLPCFIVSAQLPTGFSANRIQAGFNFPIGVVFNNAGSSMFVWDRAGHLYVCKWSDTGYVKQQTPVIDLSDEVGNWGDFGLLSCCLDPNFDQNGLVYLYYVVDRHHLLYAGTPLYDSMANDYNSATIGRVVRYHLNLDSIITADYSSRKILIGLTKKTGIPVLSSSHMGGSLIFAKDHTLLVSTGESASFSSDDQGSLAGTFYQQALSDSIIRPEENVGAFRSQLINSFSGKILRFDPNTGLGISSNPFYDSVNPAAPKSLVWALGFRNPFRMSLQPGTGSRNPVDGNPGNLIVGDVGYVTWEELNFINTPGLNCGWPLFEGESASSYSNYNTVNADDGQTFKSLCLQPASFTVAANTAQRRFTHNRPDITWRHGTADTRVPWFSGTMPTDPILGGTGSPATGEMFRGNCTVGGIYYDGDAYGPTYKNKIFFADFIKNWMRVATVKPGHPSVTAISNFAPDNFSKGIVFITQNPLDSAIIYINAFTGEIMRLNHTGNFAPGVSFTAPAAPAIFSAGSNIQLNVAATDVDGTISKVELFYNGVRLDTDSTAPYTFTGSKVEAGVYKVVAKATDNNSVVSESDTLTVTVTACSGSGTILGEGFTSISGTHVADLTSNLSYPGSPSITAQLDAFEYSAVGDNYGGRLRGYICAPLTGNYTFYIAGDDQAGLFLSSNEDSANKVLIAYNLNPVGFRAWTATATQKSAPISLVKGARYYVETLHKQSTGANHMSVGWTLPNGVNERPISASRLSPYIVNSLVARRFSNDFAAAMSAIAGVPASPAGLVITVQPNPSSNDFVLVAKSSSNRKLQIKITDAQGRIVERIFSAAVNESFRAGRKLPPGIYFVEVRQGTETIIKRLVKL